MNHKTFRILSAILFFWALIPILACGCPCALAAHEPYPGLEFQKIPCHGCCPEIQSGHLTQNFEQAEPAGFQLSGRYASLYGVSFHTVPAGSSEIFSQDKAPPGLLFPGLFSHTPAYLALEVLRL